MMPLCYSSRWGHWKGMAPRQMPLGTAKRRCSFLVALLQQILFKAPFLAPPTGLCPGSCFGSATHLSSLLFDAVLEVLYRPPVFLRPVASSSWRHRRGKRELPVLITWPVTRAGAFFIHGLCVCLQGSLFQGFISFSVRIQLPS